MYWYRTREPMRGRLIPGGPADTTCRTQAAPRPWLEARGLKAQIPERTCTLVGLLAMSGRRPHGAELSSEPEEGPPSASPDSTNAQPAEPATIVLVAGPHSPPECPANLSLAPPDPVSFSSSSAQPSAKSDPSGPQASFCKPLASRHRLHRRPHRRHRRRLPCRPQMSASPPPTGRAA